MGRHFALKARYSADSLTRFSWWPFVTLESQMQAQLGKMYLTSYIEASAVCHAAADIILDLLLLWMRRRQILSNTLNLVPMHDCRPCTRK